jgi:hypothetical protein
MRAAIICRFRPNKKEWQMKLPTRFVIGSALACAAMSAALAQTPAPADVVFVNGKVFTADAQDSVLEGFAVTGDRFVATGTSGDVRRYVGPRTTVIDLKGRFVSPGLTDDHFHNEGGGPGVDLSHVRTLGELLTTVANAAAAASPGTVIVSNSDWHEAQLREQRLPTAEELDQAAGDKPVVLVRGGHEYIVNTASLRKWNITKDTPVPAASCSMRPRRWSRCHARSRSAWQTSSPPRRRSRPMAYQRFVSPALTRVIWSKPTV